MQMLTQKHVAKRYIIAQKVVSLHHETGNMDIPEFGRKLTDINDDIHIVEFADTLMTMHYGISVLLLEKECIERFGEEYSAMSVSDWFKVIYS